MTFHESYLLPNWPAPPWVKAASTTRLGGVSSAPFDTLNMGASGDEPEAVKNNVSRIVELLNMPEAPRRAKQIHGKTVVLGETVDKNSPPEADALYTSQANVVCSVLCADCVPILVCDKSGAEVAAIHAGWRGLVRGVVFEAIERFNAKSLDLMAWIGPAIGFRVYEVGEEVYTSFVDINSNNAQCFRPSPNKRWLLDLNAVARLQLQECGVESVYSENLCTYGDPERFFSYRRQGKCGHMASMIWCEPT